MTDLEEKFVAFCKRIYGSNAPFCIPAQTRIELQYAFFAGAQAGFEVGLRATDTQALEIQHELRVFGRKVLTNYNLDDPSDTSKGT